MTSLYRMYDQLGALLYVGITKQMPERMWQHERQYNWFRDVATITVCHYGTKEEAEAEEQTAIKTEHPKYNIAHKPVTDDYSWDGAIMKRLREAADLTQGQLAAIIYTSVHNISKYEQNQSVPPVHRVMRIATALNVTTDELLGLDVPEDCQEGASC